MIKPNDITLKSLVKNKRKDSAVKTSSARDLRVKVMNEARKAHVLGIAREVFIEKGLDGASMREIAKQAGYTPGAIYSYFCSKEELYGALLQESLKRLIACIVDANTAVQPDATASLHVSAHAFFDFYRENPRDLDLGFYLFQGMKPRGLTPELNRTLNTSLRKAFAPIQEALLTMGMPLSQTQSEITGLFAHAVGLLLLNHTGRIRMFNQHPKTLFAAYLDDLQERGAIATKSHLAETPVKK